MQLGYDERPNLRDFIGLQINFGKVLSERLSCPLASALWAFTNIGRKVTVALGQGDGDHASTMLSETLNRTKNAMDQASLIEEMWRTSGTRDASLSRTHSGCFSLERHTNVRDHSLHFKNVDISGRSPFAMERLSARRAELAALAGHLAQVSDPHALVTGRSWLYNSKTYCSLFPTETQRSAAIDKHPRLDDMSLWGQVLDYRGQVKSSAGLSLLQKARHVPLESPWMAFGCQSVLVQTTAESLIYHWEGQHDGSELRWCRETRQEDKLSRA